MEACEGVLVDTNVLISKKLRVLMQLQASNKLYITPVVLLEYMNWAIASRNRALARGEKERAEGYQRLLALFPQLLLGLGIEVIDQDITIEDLVEAVELIVARNVDPGDALNAVTARRKGLCVVTQDRDWLRLRDYTADLILL